MSFRSNGTQKIFRKRIIQQRIVEGESLTICGGRASHLQEKLNYNLSEIDKKQQIKWRC